MVAVGAALVAAFSQVPLKVELIPCRNLQLSLQEYTYICRPLRAVPRDHKQAICDPQESEPIKSFPREYTEIQLGTTVGEEP